MSRRRLRTADYERLLAFRIELRRFLRHSEELAHASGLTPAIHQLLLAVRGQRGDPTIGTAAAALDVRHHTAVELAQRAEGLGLLRRTRDEHDHRQVRLHLTPDGEVALDRLTLEHLPAIAELAGHLGALAGPE